MQKKVESVIKEIAQELKLPEEVVKAIVENQASSTRAAMKVGEKGNVESYLNIRWPGFGCFIAKPGRLQMLNKYGRSNTSKENN